MWSIPNALFPQSITAYRTTAHGVAAPKPALMYWRKVQHVLTTVVLFLTILLSVIFSRLVIPKAARPAKERDRA